MRVRVWSVARFRSLLRTLQAVTFHIIHDIQNKTKNKTKKKKKKKKKKKRTETGIILWI